jgi:hypothetical protein
MRLFVSYCVMALALCFANLATARHCPACLSAYKLSTVRGQTNILYHWLAGAMDRRHPIRPSDLAILFPRHFKIIHNGRLRATNRQEALRYLRQAFLHESIRHAKLDAILVDGARAVLEAQCVVVKHGQRVRRLMFILLTYQGGKIVRWDAIDHALPLS